MRLPDLLIALRFMSGWLCIFLVTVTYYALDDLDGHRVPSGKIGFSYDSIVLKSYASTIRKKFRPTLLIEFKISLIV